jgi:hypothetical protein
MGKIDLTIRIRQFLQKVRERVGRADRNDYYPMPFTQDERMGGQWAYTQWIYRVFRNSVHYFIQFSFLLKYVLIDGLVYFQKCW